MVLVHQRGNIYLIVGYVGEELKNSAVILQIKRCGTKLEYANLRKNIKVLV